MGGGLRHYVSSGGGRVEPQVFHFLYQYVILFFAFYLFYLRLDSFFRGNDRRGSRRWCLEPRVCLYAHSSVSNPRCFIFFISMCSWFCLLFILLVAIYSRLEPPGSFFQGNDRRVCLYQIICAYYYRRIVASLTRCFIFFINMCSCFLPFLYSTNGYLQPPGSFFRGNDRRGSRHQRLEPRVCLYVHTHFIQNHTYSWITQQLLLVYG